MAAYIRLLRQNPDFTRLWMAQIVSLLGDWFNIIALSALISEYTGGSGLAVSALLIARFLPPLIVSPFVGVLVDRFNRRRLLILSDVMRAGIVLLILLATGPDRLWLIYVLTVLQFSLSAVFEPSRSAIMPSLVEPSDLIRANILSNITWSVMLAVGAVMGGVVATLFGTAIALVIDSATFALSALFIMLIQTRQTTPATNNSASGEKQVSTGGFREGLRYVSQHPDIAAILFIKLGLSIGSVDALMIAYGTTLFVIGENGTGSIGILYAAFGVGSIIGPLLLNRFNNGSAKVMRRLIIVSFTWVTIGWLLFGFAPTLLIAALALIVRAMGGSTTWTYSSTILQLSVPDAFLGRVFALDWAGFYLAITISTLITGVLIDTLGDEHIREISMGTGLISLIPLILWGVAVFWLEKRRPLPAASGD